MNYIKRLIENCNIALGAKPTRTFKMRSIDDLKNIKTSVYIITQIKGDPKETFLAFSEYRKKSERKCSSLNSPSQTMYVGSSTTGLRDRITQHIGDGSPQTYALNLKHWFSEDYSITVREYDVTPEVLQIIEDDLSDSLAPAFGKKGKNNK
jgi:hypothetical protein